MESHLFGDSFILIQYVSWNEPVDTVRSRKMWISIILVIPVLLVQAFVLPNMGDVFLILGKTTAHDQRGKSCPSHMLFDWTRNKCVCVGRTVYYPPKNSCFHPFEQGPCKPGHYLAIPKEAAAAECVINTCGNNGTVPYKNSCYSLLTTGPCKSPETLRVSGNSLELECREITIVAHHLIEAPVEPLELPPCPSGTRRTARGQCRKLI